ncbi:MFS transporter [Streptomyces sp. NPDC001083]|uniref:MFS transporter n=1 Tax=Streptomyces sp. NPDC001083 TaxID=3364545 RepID=UPI0036870372
MTHPVHGQPTRHQTVATLVFIGLVVAAMGSLGAPLVPTVAHDDHVSFVAAQWTLTISLLAGATVTPVLGRLGDGRHRRTTILAALSIVLAGSVLTALPFGGFATLVAGRGLQGCGLGLTALVIGVARDTFTGERAHSVIALLSVTSVAGVGLGYPLAGTATQLWGLHGAYTAGALVVAAALVMAIVALPKQASRSTPRIDVTGAVLLALTLAGLLFAISQADSTLPWWTITGAAAVGILFGAQWIRHELRVDSPLVDLRLVRIPAVFAADIAVLLGGIGIYLLLSLAIRFVQTPSGSGYGFGASVIVAGLMLTPFSAASFLASRTVPALARKAHADLLLPTACGLVMLCLLAFAVLRAHLWEVFAIMTVAGYGVGAVYAAAPAFIVRSVPASVTTSAVSFNLVLRTIGFATGSALAGLLLASATPAGAVLPRNHGYTTAALVGAAALALTVLITYRLRPGRGISTPQPTAAKTSIAPHPCRPGSR